MKTIKFWTEKEIKIAKKALDNSKNVAKAAIWTASALGRPLSGVAAKLYEIQRSKVVKTRKETNLELPPSFVSFEITPKRVVMHKNRMEVFY